MKPKHDWEGKPIPADEPEGIDVLVWEIDPCLHDAGYDTSLIRDYFHTLEYMGEKLELYLDRMTEAELREHGLRLKIRLIEWPNNEIPE